MHHPLLAVNSYQRTFYDISWAFSLIISHVVGFLSLLQACNNSTACPPASRWHSLLGPFKEFHAESAHKNFHFHCFHLHTFASHVVCSPSLTTFFFKMYMVWLGVKNLHQNFSLYLWYTSFYPCTSHLQMVCHFANDLEVAEGSQNHRESQWNSLTSSTPRHHKWVKSQQRSCALSVSIFNILCDVEFKLTLEFLS